MKYSKPLMWAQRSQWGGGNVAPILGMSSTFNWVSDPWDSDDALRAELHVFGQAASVPATAQVVIPSTTSPCGALFVATASGTGGNSTTVAISAPAGTTTVVTVSTAAITIAPKLGETNQGIVNAVNNTVASAALVTAYIWGYVFNGADAFQSTNVAPIITATGDLVVTTSATNLVGGATASNQTGTMYVYGTDDIVNLPYVELGTASVAAGQSSLIQIPQLCTRWLQAQWQSSGSPVGQILAAWCGKGSMR